MNQDTLNIKLTVLVLNVSFVLSLAAVDQTALATDLYDAQVKVECIGFVLDMVELNIVCKMPPKVVNNLLRPVQAASAVRIADLYAHGQQGNAASSRHTFLGN